MIICHHIMKPSIISQLLGKHDGVGDTVVTLISQVLHRHYHVLENMLCRPCTFHHTTHTSPYRRQIGKHICRQRFDAHAIQAQTARLCRARATSREQTRRVDTEHAIAQESDGPKSTQVPRPVRARSQQGNPWELESKRPVLPGIALQDKSLNCSSSIGRQERPWLPSRRRFLRQHRIDTRVHR